MPVPSAQQIEEDIKTNLRNNGFLRANFNGRDFAANFSGAWEMFIDAFTRDWTTSWKTWQDAHLCLPGNVVNVVSGVGPGTGGVVTEVEKIDFIIRWPYRRHPRFIEFETALVEVLRKEFAKWSATYKISEVMYQGSSTHTPVTPGVFFVTNVPIALKDAGAGEMPVNLRPQVEAILEGKGWNVRNPYYRTGLFLDAIQEALTKNFTEWLEKTKIIGDTATGPASAGAGVGTGPSLVTGKLI